MELLTGFRGICVNCLSWLGWNGCLEVLGFYESEKSRAKGAGYKRKGNLAHYFQTIFFRIQLCLSVEHLAKPTVAYPSTTQMLQYTHRFSFYRYLERLTRRTTLQTLASTGFGFTKFVW